jgi:hypothetical protein
MTDLQLYILIAIPLVGILSNTALFIHLSSTINSRFAVSDARIDHLTERIEAKFEVLTGKVVNIDNRLTRLEERIGIQ